MLLLSLIRVARVSVSSSEMVVYTSKTRRRAVYYPVDYVYNRYSIRLSFETREDSRFICPEPLAFAHHASIKSMPGSRKYGANIQTGPEWTIPW